MKLLNARIEPSPIADGRVRHFGNVSYDDGKSSPETYWFDVPGTLDQSPAECGDPWLVCLLPLACNLGEPLHVPLPVDPLLFENLHEVMRIWAGWYEDFQIVPLEVDGSSGLPHPTNDRMAAFFSGGVDSFYTVLRNENTERRQAGFTIDDLLLVHGFDIPVENDEAFRRLRNRTTGIAFQLGKSLCHIATNLRDTRLDKLGWVNYYGSAMAAVALSLNPSYTRILIGSAGYGANDLRPEGSHRMTT